MTGPYWTSIAGLGEKRATILVEQLGIRSIESLHASSVDEIAEALNEAGSRATTDEVEAWLRSARTQLKAETTPHWDTLVRSARTSQAASGSTRTVDISRQPALPLSSDHAFWIELELTSPTEEITELYFSIIASDGEAVVLYRPDHARDAHRWLVLKAERGLYRMGVQAPDGSMVKGPVVQVV